MACLAKAPPDTWHLAPHVLSCAWRQLGQPLGSIFILHTVLGASPSLLGLFSKHHVIRSPRARVSRDSRPVTRPRQSQTLKEPKLQLWKLLPSGPLGETLGQE